MTETVTDFALGVEWEPNIEEYVLSSDGYGKTVLALEPHPNDSDSSIVLLAWSGVAFASMGGPNDEAIEGHRLYSKGLAGVTWAGTVQESELIALLERQNSVHYRHDPSRFASLIHYVLPLKGDVVEVVADKLSVVRAGTDRLSAVSAAMRT
jgi:hypothetical protein